MHTTPVVDPTSVEAVSEALSAYIRARPDLAGAAFAGPLEPVGAGFDTYIYFFELAGTELPDGWRGQLVLRVYPSPEQGARARRETEIQSFIAGTRYPAPAVIAWEDANNPLGLPFMIMRRAPGEMMLSLISRRPWKMGQYLRSLGALHARLHELPTAGAPFDYEQPLVRTRLSESRAELLRFGLEREFAWLDANAQVVEPETPVVTHNDFHPLNVLVDAHGHATVIDWADARLGDRHHDVGRTTALLWVVGIAANSAVERVLVRLARGYMVRAYLGGYGEHLPVEPARLRYWQAFHALLGVAQVRALHEGHADPAIKQGTRDRVPPGLSSELLSYFKQRASD